MKDRIKRILTASKEIEIKPTIKVQTPFGEQEISLDITDLQAKIDCEQSNVSMYQAQVVKHNETKTIYEGILGQLKLAKEELEQEEDEH